MHTTSCRRMSRRASCLLILLAGLCLVAVPAVRAQVSGISYTLSPVGERVFWDDEAALTNGYLYGGQLGLGFGKYLQVSGLYLLGNDFETDFGAYDAFDGLGFDDVSVDIRRYGGQLRLNLGGGFGSGAELLPYLSVGTGIIRFNPGNREDTEQIYAAGGAGLTFVVADRYTLSVGGELLAYRFNPAASFLTASQQAQLPNPVGDYMETVYSPAVRAALRIHLGGREPDELTALDRSLREQFGGGGGLRLFVEPFYGRIEFNEALGFPKDQNVAGVNVGVELGPYVGLRGFYWRGVEGDQFFDGFPEEFQDIAFYGGELTLDFGSGFGEQSFVPYLLVGGGYVDVLSDYADDYQGAVPPPEGRYFATAGGGVELVLAENLSLQGGLRYLFMSNQDAADVSQPSEVYGSPMYTFGIEFSLGGGGDDRTVGEILQEREAREQARREAIRAEVSEEQRATRNRLEALQARIDSLAQALQAQATQEQTEQTIAEQQAMAGEVAQLEQEIQQLEQQAQPPARDTMGRRRPMDQRRPVSNLSGETITIPVPARGEIYIRFGEVADDGEVVPRTVYAPPTIVTPSPQAVTRPPARAPAPAAQAPELSAQEIQQIVRETLRSEIGQAEAAGRTLTEQDIRRIVQDVLMSTDISGEALSAARAQALEDRLRRLEDELDERFQRLNYLRRLEDEEAPRVRIIEEDGNEGDGDPNVRVIGGSYSPSSFVPVAGFTASGGSFVFGVRGDYQDTPSFGAYNFRFMPEVTVGVGSDISVAAIANAVLDLNAAGRYVGLNSLTPYVGAGLGLATDVGFGINLLTGLGYDLGQGSVFIEYSTLGFFDYGRFLIGYRVGL